MDQRGDLELWKGREVVRLLELVSSERRYFQEIIASLPVPLAIIGLDGECLTSNRSFRELFQLTPSDPRRRIDGIIPSADLMGAIQRAVRDRAAGCELEIGTTTGPLRVTVTGVPGWGEGAQAEALLTVTSAAELPRRKAATEPIKAPAAVWSIDPETLRFKEIAGDCAELFGAPREHWLGGSVSSFDRVNPIHRSAIAEFYRDAIAAGGEFSCEFRMAGDTKKEKWRQDIFRVVHDSPGRVCLHGVTIDTTGRHRADQHAIQAHRADALVGLSRGLAHDLNNALMIISGYSEELLAHFDEEDTRKADVQAMMSAAETIAGIAGELLGFTRSQGAPASPIRISELLTEVSTRIRTQLGAVLVTRAMDDTLVAVAESAQLEAVLLSLARALRHNVDPHMILTAGRVRVAHQMAGMPLAPSAGEYVEIVFRAPVEAALDPRAFETLLAGRNPHGADLARAYAIVRDWGGWIRAARTDHSAEVRVLLPVPAISQREHVAAAEVVQPEPPAQQTPSAATVLVVEDEQGIRTLVRRILEREGFHVLDAPNSQAAGEAIRRNAAPIDLLITDVVLPGESGRQMADRFASELPGLRTIFMSGYTDDPSLQAQTSDPGAAFLQKPFTRTALLKKVRETLSETPVAVNSATSTA